MIENYRNKMLKLADEYGLSSQQTIECSQQLDELLNLLLVGEQDNPTNQGNVIP
jgi:hypothetical protein